MINFNEQITYGVHYNLVDDVSYSEASANKPLTSLMSRVEIIDCK